MSTVQIKFVSHGGKIQMVAARLGLSVMRAAIDNGVIGILAECGGESACGTCHVYVDAAWLDRCGELLPLEAATLEFAVEAREYSRLACQIRVTADLDGLVVATPEMQKLD